MQRIENDRDKHDPISSRKKKSRNDSLLSTSKNHRAYESFYSSSFNFPPLKKKNALRVIEKSSNRRRNPTIHRSLFHARGSRGGREEEHVIEQSVTSSSSTIPGGAVEPACNENKPVLARVLTLDPVSLRSTKLKTFRYQPRAERVYIVAGGPGNPQCGDIRAGPA